MIEEYLPCRLEKHLNDEVDGGCVHVRESQSADDAASEFQVALGFLTVDIDECLLAVGAHEHDSLRHSLLVELAIS